MHSQLLEPLMGSAAVVMNEVMYNIGGSGSSHSVMQCRLSSKSKWEFMSIPKYSFNGYHNREAVLVENKIVFFGN